MSGRGRTGELSDCKNGHVPKLARQLQKVHFNTICAQPLRTTLKK